MSAIRVARGYTGRDKIIKFRGCYHGHSDGLLVKAGSAALTTSVPDSAGVPADYTKNTLVAEYNDCDSVKELFDNNKDEIAAVIVECKETFEYHYGKHLQTYVDNLNRLIPGTPYESMSLQEIVKKADGPIFNNAAQAWNHTFFFLMLTPDQKPMPQKLADRIARDFGSVEAFKEEFSKAATGLFGSGWTWLAADKDGKLQIISESNAGNPMTKGLKPVMTIDVWEHAYYIDYRNRRADFIKSYWELIDWDKVADRIFPRKYHCTACDYVYDPAKGDPESGIAPGTAFEDIPDDWVCPVCGLYKDSFKIVEEK